MSDVIVAALKALDPANDDHWTSDGLPRLGALPAGLSRKEVTDALPGFNRAAAQAAAENAQKEPEAPEGAADPQGANPDAPDAEDGDEEDAEDGLSDADDGLDRLVAEAEEADAEVKAAEEAMEAAKAALAKKVAERDAILEAKAALEPPHHVKVMTDIQEYLAAQQADREQRFGLRAAAIQAIGGPQNAKLLQPKSPLDASMTRKTGRARPSFAPKE